MDVVEVWRISLAACPDDARALLADDERERAGRFHHARDRDRFVAARAALRRILGDHAGCAPSALRFGYTDHGKPYLVGAGADLAFNLSHSHELALVAVTRGRDVGVDLEHHRPELELEDVARVSFSAAEQRALLALPPPARVGAFFRCWTRKESYIKARGEGLAMPLDRFTVSIDDDTAVRFDTDDAAERERWTIHALRIDDGYSAALTVAAPAPPVVRRDFG